MKQTVKKMGYMVFAFFFYVYRIFTRVNKDKVFCIMTHDSSMDSNVGMIVQEMKKQSSAYEFHYIKKEETAEVKSGGRIRSCLTFFLIKPYHMATAGYLFLDNIFLPMAYLHFSKYTKVVQLWHGTGTIKKFGQDANEGNLKRLEKHANQTVTHLIVNADGIRSQYAGAFGIEPEHVYATGLPRTDCLFDEEKKKQDMAGFYEQYPELKEKRIILYAPTFRDDEVSNPKVALDLDVFINRLPVDCVCIIKLHPFVAKQYSWTKEQQERYKGRVFNLSEFPDINTLLFVADALITDYSSIIYEYCLQDKPMIFFAYDLEHFEQQGRGFYEPYESFVPGMVVKNMEEVIEAIQWNVYEDKYDRERIEWFRERYYHYFDGRSTERVIRLVTEKE
ncbi:CDP-glycerol glycerophosphotransferase family protein [Anaerosporobacter faecicola]|uniref:CDP-glycerol glycerophosphotransferase family protein n=1 Tax=Anaerosporobacter faecicola TaxID=2718714 RepID=UPI00143BE84E|nr:CDP-glycerol glycerophosphotransferase family protein [Anaerosporobacter faecicola]